MGDASYYPSDRAPMPQGEPDGLLLEAETLNNTAWDRYQVKLDEIVSGPRKRARSDTTTETLCFATRIPILSLKECAWVIQTAENHAASNGGWTTARHYAVPTTDIPLHSIPPLLRWFNGILKTKLRPLL